MHTLVPLDTTLKASAGTVQRLTPINLTPETHTIVGYGMVGTGRTQAEARSDLFEKIRTAGAA